MIVLTTTKRARPSGPARQELRAAARFPIRCELIYKIRGRKYEATGRGVTVNIGRDGILFTADQPLVEGMYLELIMNWPASLKGETTRDLVAFGRVVRCKDGQVALKFRRHEFRTQRGTTG